MSRLLNSLYAGILPALYDPKNFIDYSEFAGVIPMGCTIEHRDVILRSLWAEMVRRQQMLSQLVGKDRHGRTRPIEGAWKVDRDGPPILSIWDEFHLEAKDALYVGRIATLCRLQRATASGVLVATQGGGLKDLGDSVLRDLLKQAGLEVYRMSKQQAGLGGYDGEFNPNDLPRIPGTMLKITGEGGPEVPMRAAFVTREDEDGSIYDHLYAPDGSQILFAPVLPDETVEVFEREGLMDLWRMGQGEGGLARLQAGNGDAFVPAPAAAGIQPAAAATKAKPIEGREMILAILASGPIRTFGDIHHHQMWLDDPGRDSVPSSQTIHRPLIKLETEGLVVNPERPDVWRELTPKGQQVAAKALLAYQLAVGRTPAGTAGVPASPAEPGEAEQRLLQQSEQERMIREDIAATAEH